MQWALNKNHPLCPQLCHAISVEISAGTFPPGARLPSVREVAAEAGVNPNTVQKAFAELERQRVIRSVRSVGWFVCDSTAPAREAVQVVMREKTAEYFRSMRLLGLTAEEIQQYVKEWSE